MTTPIERILAKLSDARVAAGGGWEACCPAHDDRTPSLSINEGAGGRALLYCHAGCETAEVCESLGLSLSDLMPEREEPLPHFEARPAKTTAPEPARPDSKPFPKASDAVAALERRHGKRSAMWQYQDADGRPVGLVVRWDRPEGGKDIRPVSLRPDGWHIGAMPDPRPLYHLPELDAASRVIVTEGEKACDAARSIGYAATTSAGGSKAPHKTDWRPLAGREVLILPDNDEPGRQYARVVAGILAKLSPAPAVRVVELPGLPDGGDVFDWLEVRDSLEPDDLRAELERLAYQGQDIPMPAPAPAPVPMAPTPPTPPTPKRKWPAPVPITQLPDRGPVVDWLCNGLIARRHITMFSALMKAGKTTFMSHLLRALQSGTPFIGRETRRCRTLFISEESTNIWRGRRDALALDDHLSVLCRPMLAKPTLAEWVEFIAYVKDCAAGFDLIVFDTLGAFAPWRNENDAAEVAAAMTPLNRLTEADFGVHLFHHHGKGDGAEGRAARGSTAIPGAVDILLEMRRFKPNDLEDRRRVLTGLGRFDEIPTELVISLAADGTGYTLAGDRRAETARDLSDILLAVLPTDPPGVDANTVHADLPEIGRPQRSVVLAALKDGAARGWWETAGAGKKGDPQRFWRPTRDSGLVV